MNNNKMATFLLHPVNYFFKKLIGLKLKIYQEGKQ